MRTTRRHLFLAGAAALLGPKLALPRSSKQASPGFFLGDSIPDIHSFTPSPWVPSRLKVEPFATITRLQAAARASEQKVVIVPGGLYILEQDWEIDERDNGTAFLGGRPIAPVIDTQNRYQIRFSNGVRGVIFSGFIIR